MRLISILFTSLWFINCVMLSPFISYEIKAIATMIYGVLSCVFFWQFKVHYKKEETKINIPTSLALEHTSSKKYTSLVNDVPLAMRVFVIEHNNLSRNQGMIKIMNNGISYKTNEWMCIVGGFELGFKSKAVISGLQIDTCPGKDGQWYLKVDVGGTWNESIRIKILAIPIGFFE